MTVKRYPEVDTVAAAREKEKRGRGNVSEWKRGFPPGKYYEGMTDDYEMAFTPLAHWYRKRTPEEKAAYIIERYSNQEKQSRSP